MMMTIIIIVSMSMSRLPLTLELSKEVSTGTFDLFLHFFVIFRNFYTVFSVTKICTLTLKLLLKEPSSRILDSVSIFLYDNFLGISIYLLLFI